MALEVRVCLKGLILVSQGRPARSQGDREMRELRLGVLGSENGVSVMGYGSMSVG